MKTITTYEVGIDPPPINGAEVLLLNHNPAGPVRITVDYLAANGVEVPDNKDFCIDPHRLNQDSVVLHCNDHITLMLRGMRWCYPHDYYPAFGAFPYITWSQWELAHEKGWITSEKTGETFSDPASGARIAMVYKNFACNLGDDKYYVTWKFVYQRTSRGISLAPHRDGALIEAMLEEYQHVSRYNPHENDRNAPV